MLDSKDYDRFLDKYLRARYDWALADLGKPGLDKSKAVSVHLSAQEVRKEIRKDRKGVRTISELVLSLIHI